jgi:predicted nucleic acid-binding protein
MSVYLDASVLIAYLYEETAELEQARQAQPLFDAISASKVKATIAFYSLTELYGYAVTHYPETHSNEIFRLSLVDLFSIPLVIRPFVDRNQSETLRRRFTISDPTDVTHVVAALAFGCDAIITFDHHFQQVADLIPVFTPAAYLAALADLESE